MAAKHKLFVYGTLRPGTGETVEIPGSMYDLGWYPGVRLGEEGCNSHFVAEVLEVSDSKLEELDQYEGYNPNKPLNSLYLRVRYKDGWIYEYNHPMEAYTFIPGGDWLAHSKVVEEV